MMGGDRGDGLGRGGGREGVVCMLCIADDI